MLHRLLAYRLPLFILAGLFAWIAWAILDSRFLPELGPGGLFYSLNTPGHPPTADPQAVLSAILTALGFYLAAVSLPCVTALVTCFPKTSLFGKVFLLLSVPAGIFGNYAFYWAASIQPTGADAASTIAVMFAMWSGVGILVTLETLWIFMVIYLVHKEQRKLKEAERAGQAPA